MTRIWPASFRNIRPITPVLAAALVALVSLFPLNLMAAETVIISRADCSQMVSHEPAPGVAYKPGVDVDGKPVVPADLGGQPKINLPETIYIPITVEIAKRYGIPATSDLYKPEAKIGTARVRLKDGRAWFNDKPLTSDESHALSTLCRKIMAGEKP